MLKTPILLAIAALLGGSLAVLEWRSAQTTESSDTTLVQPDSDADGEEAPATESTSPGEELAAIDPVLPKASGSVDGMAKSWEVIPMNQAGQLLYEARLTAVPGEGVDDDALSAVGRTTWKELSSGEWTLTIEAEDLPVWSKALILFDDRTERTTAYLGNELRIEGRVVDLNGDPVGGLAYLLPGGTGHPERTDMVRENGDSKGKFIPSNGAVPLTLGPKGTFKTVLPKAGPWRFSVGPPGDPRWTQPRGTRLENGGPDSVTVTIPAESSLRVTFDGDANELPSEVVVFAYQGQLNRGRSPGATQADQAIKNAPPDAAERARREAIFAALPSEERDAVKESIARGELDSVADWTPRPDAPEERATSPLEDGWCIIRSSRPGSRGEAILQKLPTETDLRLMFVRDGSKIATPSSIRLRSGKMSVANVALPPIGTTSRDRTDLRASLMMVSEPSGEAPRQVGVIWE